jgi:hypothetical protein
MTTRAIEFLLRIIANQRPIRDLMPSGARPERLARSYVVSAALTQALSRPSPGGGFAQKPPSAQKVGRLHKKSRQLTAIVQGEAQCPFHLLESLQKFAFCVLAFGYCAVHIGYARAKSFTPLG